MAISGRMVALAFAPSGCNRSALLTLPERRLEYEGTDAKTALEFRDPPRQWFTLRRKRTTNVTSVGIDVSAVEAVTP
jgi:hypothetical protein